MLSEINVCFVAGSGASVFRPSIFSISALEKDGVVRDYTFKNIILNSMWSFCISSDYLQHFSIIFSILSDNQHFVIAYLFTKHRRVQRVSVLARGQICYTRSYTTPLQLTLFDIPSMR